MINNEDIVKVAFYDELEKIAINVKGLRQANNAVKNKLIRRSVVDVIGGGFVTHNSPSVIINENNILSTLS